MNTKTTIILLAVLLIVVSIFSYRAGVRSGIAKSGAVASSTLSTSGILQNGATNTQNNGQVPSASFSCVDKTHFIAEFPNDLKVNIFVNGNLARALPRVNGDGQRFEDSSYVYVFAGEEVSVTSKASKKTTTCSQPMDANNAPMNFGDAAEGGAGFATTGNQTTTKPDVTLLVSQSIVGKWQSNQDTKFVREFTNTGKVSDYYDSKLVTSGDWRLFTSVKPLKVSFPIEKDTIYVQLTDTADQSATLNFKLTKISPETLELIYMERGSTNTFTRIK